MHYNFSLLDCHILHYNFSPSDCHFSLIFLEGEVTSPNCQGAAWTLMFAPLLEVYFSSPIKNNTEFINDYFKWKFSLALYKNFFCDTVQCFFEEKWTVGNYLHFTLHLHRYFQVEKQR